MRGRDIVIAICIVVIAVVGIHAALNVEEPATGECQYANNFIDASGQTWSVLYFIILQFLIICARALLFSSFSSPLLSAVFAFSLFTDCGMKLQPVFAEDIGNAQPSSTLAQLPAGTVAIDGATQRLLGIRLAPV